MNTDEKLQAIRAKCEELLEIASKRTPGEWENRTHTKGIGTKDIEIVGDIVCEAPESWERSMEYWPSNAIFIAACAGPAEAGWRATIAAIDWLLEIDAAHLPICQSIITAWEGII